ncbi:MAG TPA: hypothetical protein VIY73_10610 [Polyangiaceae bacterium]
MRLPLFLFLSLVGSPALFASEALAAEGTDGAYGRLQGDLTLVAGVGGVAAPRGPRGEGELRVRYLESVGVFGSYEDGALFGSGAEPRRVVTAGAEVRPFFLGRWLTGREAHRARFDLVLDSVGLELAAVWSQPAGASFGHDVGMQAGLAVEVPIVGDATGPWLGIHGGLRWSEQEFGSGRASDADDRGAYLAITLAWHQVVVAHVVDAGDEAPR